MTAKGTVPYSFTSNELVPKEVLSLLLQEKLEKRVCNRLAVSKGMLQRARAAERNKPPLRHTHTPICVHTCIYKHMCVYACIYVYKDVFSDIHNPDRCTQLSHSFCESQGHTSFEKIVLRARRRRGQLPLWTCLSHRGRPMQARLHPRWPSEIRVHGSSRQVALRWLVGWRWV